MAGAIDGIVTAPINKEALNAAGYAFAGHTEILAELTGSKGSCMLLAHDRLKVSHVTTHVALADVPKRITPERLRRVFALTHQAMVDLGIPKPRIGVAALNPHAGENGLFGREDIDVIAPVIEEFRGQGMSFAGPVPGDTVFVKALGGQFDAVVAMFHDQGHVAVKTLGFAMDPATGRMTALSGVNVTLGLPIVRTSVDHGTAFDIAGPRHRQPAEHARGDRAGAPPGRRARRPQLRPRKGRTFMGIAAKPLKGLVVSIFRHAGSDADEAEAIAEHLIDANLVGHDSHGVIRILPYLKLLQQGGVRANRQASIMQDGGALIAVDGQQGYGQVVARQAIALGIERARKYGVAVVGLRNASHIGRIGAWAEQAAARPA